MQISYTWLQEYFEKKLPQPKELSDLLNIRAFEVEDIVEKKDDSIFEIKITPDRAPDCLSHLGIARELSVHIKQPYIQKNIPSIESHFETNYTVEVQKDAAIRYTCIEIKNVQVTESPLELKEKLERIGQRSINTIVDITNLVMYEIGQPLHAFDADKMSGKKITVGTPRDLYITTLDLKEIELQSDDIVVQDESHAIAIAGIKGGKKAEVDMNTKNIILESANFFPAKVRKTSKRIAIQNDSSKRFENGLTPTLTEDARALAVYYIKKYASSEATQFSNIIDVYPRPQKRKYSVGLDISHVSKKLGITITEEEILEILKRIGIDFKKVSSIEELKNYTEDVLKKPYLLGASVLFDAPHMFDCSSLQAYMYSLIGVQIPRTSIDQLVFGTEVSKEELCFGDLVFSSSQTGDIHFETKDFLKGTKFEQGVDHVGMYLDDNKILHSSRYQEEGSVIENITDSKQFTNIVAYRRIMTEKDFPRYVLSIPFHRLDLKTEIDIIEEIGRTYGYEHIVPSEPILPIQKSDVSVYEKIATIKSILVELGFDEVVTYSFQNKGDIAVVKPLAKDKAYLRNTLQKGLQDALDLNIKNKELFATECIKIFEVGHVFTNEVEKTVLALGVKSSNKKIKPKQILEQTLSLLFEKVGVTVSVVVQDNQEIIELDLDPILRTMSCIDNNLTTLPDTLYTSFSMYPFITRDIAVWASGSKIQEDIASIISQYGSNLLLRYDLFDMYQAPEKTSYGYRLVFQSLERTLTDEEINPIMEKIYTVLSSDSDFEIR